MTITIYGIKNCDTMKKARAWLDGHGVAYDFHDYKTAGIAKDKLKQWSDDARLGDAAQPRRHHIQKLPDGDKEGLNERKALALMPEQPSMIKRPVLDLGGKLLVGFKPDIYAREVEARESSVERRHTPSTSNSILKLLEFQHVAGRDAPGRAMEKVAIDDGAKFRHRQLVVAAHQIVDLESTFFADGLQRRDDMA